MNCRTQSLEMVDMKRADYLQAVGRTDEQIELMKADGAPAPG